MKRPSSERLCWIWLVALGASAAGAAEAMAPAVALRVNGRGPGAAVELWRGEPVIVEVTLQNPDRAAKDPILLEPPAGGWATRVTVLATSTGGRTSNWTFVAAGKPSGGALSLQPNATTTLVFRLQPADSTAPAKGHYDLVARLELADGKGWRGTARSEPAAVEVVDAPAEPKEAALGRRQLLRVTDALLAADLGRAEAAMKEMLAADVRRPEGFVAMGLISEAKGERELALVAIDLAIARAADPGTSATQPAAGAAAKERENAVPALKAKPVPLEYYDLRRRFEMMPPHEKPPRG